MTVVVGYLPHRGGRGALDLGIQIAHARGEPMTVVTVVPRQWSTPSPARIDAEFGEYARQVGEQARAQAQEYLSEATVDVPTTYRSVPGRSVSRTLVDVVGSDGGSTLVVGSSADGPTHRIIPGSTTEKLLHVAPVATALAPRGYRSVAADGVARLTVGFSDGPASVRTVEAAATLAGTIGAGLRVASFGVRNATMYPPEVGLHAEDSVLDSWSDQAVEAQRRLVADGVVAPDVPCVIGTGSGWDGAVAAVEWQRGELLVLGSSDTGPLARVFLGSRAAKLIRASPVPVLVLPA